MVRAVFEGIAFALKDVASVFEENGIEISELSLTGGGALSPFWNRMMSSIYGKPVKIPHAPKQATSLGAALAAGVGSGIFGSYEAAAEVVSFERSIRPDEEESGKYRKIYTGFRNLYPAYKALSDVLSESRD